MGKPGSPQSMQRLVDELLCPAVSLCLSPVRFVRRCRGFDARSVLQGAAPSRPTPRSVASQTVVVQHPAQCLSASRPRRAATALRPSGMCRRPGRTDAADAAGHRSGTLAASSQRVAGSVSDADYSVLFRGFWLSRDCRADGSADRYGDVSFGAGQGLSAQPACAKPMPQFWPMAASLRRATDGL